MYEGMHIMKIKDYFDYQTRILPLQYECHKSPKNKSNIAYESKTIKQIEV